MTTTVPHPTLENMYLKSITGDAEGTYTSYCNHDCITKYRVYIGFNKTKVAVITNLQIQTKGSILSWRIYVHVRVRIFIKAKSESKVEEKKEEDRAKQTYISATSRGPAGGHSLKSHSKIHGYIKARAVAVDVVNMI